MSLLLLLAAPTPTISDTVSAIPNLSARWRADQISGLANGAPVSAWPDASGYGRAATQATPTNQPIYQSAGIGGKPSVRFTASATTFLSSAAPAGGPEQTVIAVVKTASSGVTHTIRAGEGGNVGDGALQLRIETDNYLLLLQQNQAGIGRSGLPVATGTAATVAATFSDSANIWSFLIDGADAGSGTYGSSLTPEVTRIGAHPAGNEALDGDLAELIVWDRVLTSTELATVQTYLSGRYFTAPPSPATAAGGVTLAGTATAAAGGGAAGGIALAGTTTPQARVSASGAVALAASTVATVRAAAAGAVLLDGASTAAVSATAPGAVTLTGTTSAITSATSSGTIALGSTVTTRAPVTASGAILLGGTGTARGVATASGSVDLGGTATAFTSGTVTATGLVSLSGTASARGATSAASGITLGGSAVASTVAAATATGGLSLTGTATAQTFAAATGTVTIGGAIAARVPATVAGAIFLSGLANAATTVVFTATFAGRDETVTVSAEDRITRIHPDDRTYAAAGDPRVFAVAAETRIVT